MLRKIAATKKPILLSTGMADLKDIAASLTVLRQAKSGPVILLHCRSTYPTSPQDVDLRAIETMRQRFKLPVGFSDHTLGIGVPTAAAALGAAVIEKHFYLDDGVHTVDDKFSLNPGELTTMVKWIKQAEAAVGKARKKPTPAELKERMWRRSLWVVREIKAGELFSKESVKSLRPNLGLSPLYIDQVLGKRAKKNITKNTPLTRKMIKGFKS
ncbi:MAG: N-acetylneuraminate synthase family protein [Candidatus Chisholmbacteria bacterium]|nr:N-acetylneuraminate synthase family protein [Candidatus Chisholmbacteria bacterium]